jgi:hypothetical protein
VGSILAKHPGRRRITGYTLSFYYRKLQGISIFKACEILAKLGCADDTFHRAGTGQSKKYTRCTPAQVENRQGWFKGGIWYNGACLATDVGQIEFLGGPPTRWGIHKGSLFTLLIDRIAAVILLDGARADMDLRLEDYIPKRA